MAKHHPFRFGVQAHRAGSAKEWRDQARRIESMGYSAFYVPDHFDDQLAPIAAMMAAADATEKLRIGSLVFDNDYRHPVVLAKEAATLDLLSDGRLDLGLGAGWQATDYEESGIPFDSPGQRIDRLQEAIKIIKGILAGGSFSFTGKHYSIHGLEGYPLPAQRPHPPILIGGGGRRILTVAAREADIVHINYNLSEGHVNPTLVSTGRAANTDEKLGWVKAAAGERFDDIELAATMFFTAVTDDREALAHAVAPRLELNPDEILEMPHFLIGTVEQIVEDIQARRERFGFSFIVVQDEAAEDLAPVVQRLAGT